MSESEKDNEDNWRNINGSEEEDDYDKYIKCFRCKEEYIPCKHHNTCLYCKNANTPLKVEWAGNCIFCILYEQKYFPMEWDSLSDLFANQINVLINIGYNHGMSGSVLLGKFNNPVKGLKELYLHGFNQGTLQRTHRQCLYYIATLVLSPWLCANLVSLVLTY